MAVTRVRAHGFAFNGNSAVCTGVGLHWFGQPRIGLFWPCIGSFDLLLSRSAMRWVDRTSVGLFDLSLGVSTLCLVFRRCVGLAAYAGAGSGEPVTWDTNHLTPAELPRLRVSVLACMRTNGRDWVSGTSAIAAGGVSVGVVVERRVLVGHVSGRRMS